MHIQWNGLSSFRIQTNNSVLVTNPFADSVGVAMPKLKADIVLISDTKNDLCNNTKRLSGDSITIIGPGEYEIKQTFIYGIAANNTSTVYVIEDEGIHVGFLGALDSGLTNDQLETLEGVDILLLPVSTLPKDQLSVIVSQVEPRVVIPYLYQQPHVKVKLEPLQTFLKELGVKTTTAIEKYSIKEKDLPQDDTTTVILTPTTA
ncbi:MAG: MBL fold metallo-hydrolase [Patescibacteria group bacterium]|jgi:L-ascorbate metabolism protein UlaG (beta-lactamase superfamily)